MAKQTSKMATPAGKTTTTKPPSPKKSKKTPNMRKKLFQKKEATIHVVVFEDPIALEVYNYTLTESKAGFINNYRKWSKGEIQFEDLTEANFIGLKIRRNNEINGNETLSGSDGYSRWWMIWYPLENESTPDTRKEGLRVINNFFMSKKGTDFPPRDIKLVDDTDGDVPAVLEMFFMDDDIEEILQTSFKLTEMNDNFYEKYTTFAKNIYSKQDPSHFAKLILGFPSL
jgi:hypothetical protein